MGMSIDEAIKHAEKVAEVQDEAAKEWHENQVRKCEAIPFAEMDYTHENECKKCAKEHRQLAEWLKELKQLREQTRWTPVSEGLPKVADCYAVTEKIGDDSIVKGCFYDRTGNWHDDNWINHERNYLTNIVAWMPMPKSYEPQESEEKDEN